MPLDNSTEWTPAIRAQVEGRPILLLGPVPGYPELFGLWMWGSDGASLQDSRGRPSMTCRRDAFDAVAADPRAMLLDLARNVLEDEGTEHVAVIMAMPC